VIVSDLNKPKEPKRVWDKAVAELGGIDVLINNAGFGDFGAFTGT
jgi:short-subunit dehydrogenase